MMILVEGFNIFRIFLRFPSDELWSIIEIESVPRFLFFFFFLNEHVMGTKGLK